MSSSIPSWQILTAHAQPFRGGRDLAFCLKVPLDSLLVWANSECSGETARMSRLAWTFAARIGDKYQIRLTRSISCWFKMVISVTEVIGANRMSILGSFYSQSNHQNNDLIDQLYSRSIVCCMYTGQQKKKTILHPVKCNRIQDTFLDYNIWFRSLHQV